LNKYKRSQRVGSCKKDLKINETWKQYSTESRWLSSDDFQQSASSVPVENDQKSPKKNRRDSVRNTNFMSEYCFHVSSVSEAFLPDTVTFSHLFGWF
jgi:hypothetical protein